MKIEGANDLQVGENTVKVIVTEENGTVTTYTVDVNVAPSVEEIQQNNGTWLIVVIILSLAIIAETTYIIIKHKKEK